uniref:Peptidase S9 prolyl oligopeptidase catalytic domain-containing protein n=1 Tax=Parascaris equorum TaxID=6256 RepID=A0A914RG55_PAREQ
KYFCLVIRRKFVNLQSYGGFVSAHVVEHDNKQTFKCAVSVAPVTNFKYYDATYTERYMGAANELAYERTDLMRNVSSFRNVRFLLVHGIADGFVIHCNKLNTASIGNINHLRRKAFEASAISFIISYL